MKRTLGIILALCLLVGVVPASYAQEPARYSLKLLSPFVLLGGAYWLGTAFEPRTVYASLPELLKDLPSFLPTVILLYTLYTVGYCLFALTRIVLCDGQRHHQFRQDRR